VVLAVLAVELVVLAVRRRRTGRGPTLVELVANAAAGATLALALRSALLGQGPLAIAAWLLLAAAAHYTDLALRLRRG
jgi:hypothetical protein